jgi:perosamine synthetase
MFELTYFRGRVALFALLKALDIGPGDEVAIQAFTCLAVPEAVLAVGARPKYIDIGSTGFNMNPKDLDSKVNNRTRAVVVQHTYGIPADMDRICEIAKKRNVPVVEDCCHTFSSTLGGKKVGSFGAGSFYSFEWGKPIVAGVGGAAVINDVALREKVQRQYETYHLPRFMRSMRIELQYLAFKTLYRPSFYWSLRSLFHCLESFNAAEGNYNIVSADKLADDFTLKMSRLIKKRLVKEIGKMEQIECWSRQVSNEYRSRISNSSVGHAPLPSDSDVDFVRYPILVGNKTELLKQARNANIELSEWYATPVHPLKPDSYRTVYYEASSCGNAEERCKQIVTLPTNERVSKRDVDKIVSFLNNNAR